MCNWSNTTWVRGACWSLGSGQYRVNQRDRRLNGNVTLAQQGQNLHDGEDGGLVLLNASVELEQTLPINL
jgi:hypothetical protein